MRGWLAIVSMAAMFSGCATQPQEIDPAEFAGVDAANAHCGQLYEQMGSAYMSHPSGVADIALLADRIGKDNTALTKILTMPVADIGAATRRGNAAATNALFVSMRRNAIKVLKDDYCGVSFDEYITHVMFPDVQAVEDTALNAQYRAFNTDRLSYDNYLLLQLAAAVSAGEAAK